MINMDEDALICDLAETYHIFDYKSIPVKLVGTFACGLRNNSRIMMQVSGAKIEPEQMLLAGIVDNTQMIAWLQSENGRKNVNRPKSVLAQLSGNTENDTRAFSSGQEFEDEWNRLTGGEH